MKHYKTPDGSVWAFEMNNSQDHLIADDMIPCEQPVPNPAPAPTYRELRAAAYPSIVDQLDLIYHGGIEGWKAAIAAVKDEFPKVELVVVSEPPDSLEAN